MNDPPWEEVTDRSPIDHVRWGGVELRPGSQVRLQPRGGADILDIALQGKIATIETIEQDLEDRMYVAVIVDDDPGKDWGRMRKIAHRFFFSLDEVEPVDAGSDSTEG
ncbi:MAG TPA: hypothetical protein VHC22_10230 [Pirellulales bacterium]|nr:hypothetical protein [Pirellulales bacterium]